MICMSLQRTHGATTVVLASRAEHVPPFAGLDNIAIILGLVKWYHSLPPDLPAHAGPCGLL